MAWAVVSIFKRTWRVKAHGAVVDPAGLGVAVPPVVGVELLAGGEGSGEGGPQDEEGGEGEQLHSESRLPEHKVRMLRFPRASSTIYTRTCIVH